LHAGSPSVRTLAGPAVYVNKYQGKAGPVAVSFFGGPDGIGARVWSAGKFVSEQQDLERLRARISELEALCTDVLVAGVHLGLPQHVLNQLWAAVGHGDMPAAYRVDLPPPTRAADGASEAGSATTRPQRDLRPIGIRKTVAVVDDDPMMLDVLERILQCENFELLLAGGGPEIIKRMRDYSGTLDLLVTDYAMPGMQGHELAEHMRSRFPAVKVLYQTGFSDKLFENRTELEEGAAFLEKPFTARGLREAVRLVLFGSIYP
jgi:CheY-like chemotaxis protein